MTTSLRVASSRERRDEARRRPPRVRAHRWRLRSSVTPRVLTPNVNPRSDGDGTAWNTNADERPNARRRPSGHTSRASARRRDGQTVKQSHEKENAKREPRNDRGGPAFAPVRAGGRARRAGRVRRLGVQAGVARAAARSKKGREPLASSRTRRLSSSASRRGTWCRRRGCPSRSRRWRTGGNKYIGASRMGTVWGSGGSGSGTATTTGRLRKRRRNRERRQSAVFSPRRASLGDGGVRRRGGPLERDGVRVPPVRVPPRSTRARGRAVTLPRARVPPQSSRGHAQAHLPAGGGGARDFPLARGVFSSRRRRSARRPRMVIQSRRKTPRRIARAVSPLFSSPDACSGTSRTTARTSRSTRLTGRRCEKSTGGSARVWSGRKPRTSGTTSWTTRARSG